MNFFKAKPGDEFHNIISENPRKYIIYFIYFILFISIVIAGFRFYVVGYDIDRFLEIPKEKIVEFSSSFALAVISSVFGALFFAYLESKRTPRNWKNILKFAPPEFYRSLFNNIAHYEGIIRKDHSVKINIREHKTREDIFLCDLTYSYNASRLPRILKFKVHRLRNHDDIKSIPLLAEECLDHEFIWHNAEYDFPTGEECQNLKSDDYSLSYLQVGEREYTKDIKRTKNNEKELEYTCDIRKKINSYVFINYRVTVPVEKETSIQITSEFISNDSRIEFDYSSIGDSIIPHMACHAGIRENIIIDNDSDANVINARIRGWALPRNGWVISWWKND